MLFPAASFTLEPTTLDDVAKDSPPNKVMSPALPPTLVPVRTSNEPEFEPVELPEFTTIDPEVNPEPDSTTTELPRSVSLSPPMIEIVPLDESDDEPTTNLMSPLAPPLPLDNCTEEPAPWLAEPPCNVSVPAVAEASPTTSFTLPLSPD
jgi:hypothetical protein